MSSRPTLTDVAEAAGVSPATVSRVLNRRRSNVRISEATSERVRAAASSLGYIPSAAARALRTGRTQTIGVLASSPDVYLHLRQAGFVAEVFAGIMRGALDAGYHLCLLTGWDAAVDAGSLGTLGFADGLLVVNRDLEHDDATVSALGGTTRPVVYTLDYPVRGDLPSTATAVSPDDAQGGRLAVERLLAAGHTRIGFARLPSHGGMHDIREKGWREALASAGITPEPAWVTELPSDPSFIQASALTAVVCGNEPIAAAVWEAAQVAGLDVPADVALVCFGHTDSRGTPSSKRFPSVVHPLADTVEQALRVLVSMVAGAAAPAPPVRVPYTWHGTRTGGV